MKLSTREWVLVGAGILAVSYGTWKAMYSTGHPETNANGEAPVRESVAVGVNAAPNMLGIGPNGFTDETRLLHFFHPDHHLVNDTGIEYVNLKHRYPTVTGTNISTLIHRGYSPLMVPSQRDYDWLVDPPADSEFGG